MNPHLVYEFNLKYMEKKQKEKKSEEHKSLKLFHTKYIPSPTENSTRHWPI